VISVRPVAVFWMHDEHGPDAKILCVPANDSRYVHIQDLLDVDVHVLGEIGHFFDVYKDLDPGKGTDTRGWETRAHAEDVIKRAARQAARGPA
jgi:inorganic pyrophosphatase